jgi:hypothetical protein
MANVATDGFGTEETETFVGVEYSMQWALPEHSQPWSSAVPVIIYFCGF